MGLILSALAAAGDSGVQSMNQEIDLQNKLSLQQNASDLELSRDTQLLKAKMDIADQVRQQHAADINSAVQPILDQGIVSKAVNARAQQLPAYDPSDTSGDASFHGSAQDALAAINSMADGPDKQAALQQLQSQVLQQKTQLAGLTLDDLTPQEKAQFSPTASDQTNARIQAAEQLGLIEPKDMLNAQSKDARLDTWLQVQGMKSDTASQIAAARNDAFMARTQAQYDAATAKIDAVLSKSGNGGTDFDKKVALLRQAGASDQEIKNFILERKQPSLEDLANGFLKSDPLAGTKNAMTPEQAYGKARTLRSLTQTINDQAPSPAASAASAPATGSPTRPPLSSFFN